MGYCNKQKCIIEQAIDLKLTNSMLHGLIPFFKKGSVPVILRKCTKTWYWVQDIKSKEQKPKAPLCQSSTNTNGNTPSKVVTCNLNSARGVDSRYRNSDICKKIKYKIPNKTDKNSVQSINLSQNNIENLRPEEDDNNKRYNKPAQQKIVTNNTIFFTSKYSMKI
jgi:hypothetical protein